MVNTGLHILADTVLYLALMFAGMSVITLFLAIVHSFEE